MWNVQIVWFLRVRSNKLLLCTTCRLLWTPGWQEILNIATIPQLQEVICPIFKDEHNDHCFREFVGRRPKMYYLVDEKNVVYNATKDVLRNVVIEGKKTNVKNIELYKYTRGNKSKWCGDWCAFSRINNQNFTISILEQMKMLMTGKDNKRWIDDDNVHNGIRTL